MKPMSNEEYRLKKAWMYAKVMYLAKSSLVKSNFSRWFCSITVFGHTFLSTSFGVFLLDYSLSVGWYLLFLVVTPFG